MTFELYAVNSAVILTIFFVVAFLFLETGYRLGRKSKILSSDPIKSQFSAIQGSLLGLISLLLGFTFSLANHHYDKRSEAVVVEANAIGTAYLRAHALPDSVRKETLTTLGTYVDVRIQANQLSLTNEAARKPMLREASQLRAKLWNLAMLSLKDDDRVSTTGSYIQGLNDLIDAFGERDEIINRHVPQFVILVFFVTFVLAAGVLGYTSGAADHRPTMAVNGYMIIIVILFGMIIDLDRPRRGFIQVSQQNMLDLQEEIRTGP